MDTALLANQIKTADVIIAADRGLEALQGLGIRPHFIIGDFDSASEEAKATLASYEADEAVTLVRLQPEKDDTDTEAALQLAFAHSTGDITILGGTGTRLDHVLGNISILGQGLEHGRNVYLVDAHNRIRMIDSDVTITRAEQYGKFISLFPFGGPVTGVTLEGFKYPLTDATLEGCNSLGVSNELNSDRGRIAVKSGKIILMETLD